MGEILTVRFSEGDVIDQLFQLKVSALKNADVPALWRMTKSLMELLLAAARKEDQDRWPMGYISQARLLGVPVDYVPRLPAPPLRKLRDLPVLREIANLDKSSVGQGGLRYCNGGTFHWMSRTPYIRSCGRYRKAE